MAQATTSSLLNNALAFFGTALGLLVFFVPEVNKTLAIILALVMGTIFAPFRRQPDDVEPFVELLRYACIAWAVVVGLQQSAKIQFPIAAPVALSKATIDIVDDQRRGHLPDLQIARLSRSPMFDAPGSYLVQPVTGSEAVALPLIPVIERAARERSRDVEGDLINLGGIALFLGGLLRLVGALLLALARRPPAPTAEEASA